MKKQEIKKLSKDEVVKNIDKLKKDLFNFRFQKINSQVTNPAKIGETRKTIARLKTILKGKGSPEFYACRVKPGRILFEVDGVSEQIAKEALYKASAKLPIKTKTIKRFA